MRVLVCGGRDYDDYAAIQRVLRPYLQAKDVIITGGCSGVDTIAHELARDWGTPYNVFPAYWGKHGKAAGPIRNKQMIDEGKPDLVVAFPGGRGTADMVNQAERAGIRIIKVEE